MKFSSVDAVWLRYQIPHSKQHQSDFGRLQTFDMTLVRPLLREFARDTFTIRDGEVEIPDRPGLGVEVDEEFVRAYTYRSEE